MEEQGIELVRQACAQAGLGVVSAEPNPERGSARFTLARGPAQARLELSERFLRELPQAAALRELTVQWARAQAGRMAGGGPAHWVSRAGLPLDVEFQWPPHRSTSGADWYVVHGLLRLTDGSGLEAEVAGNLTLTIADKLATIEQVGADFLVLNAMRKAADEHQLEFRKSGKLQPVQLSMRHWNLSGKRFSFSDAREQDLPEYLKKKLFWSPGRAWIVDPCDGLYLNATQEKLLAAAQALAAEGWMELDGEYAVATAKLKQEEPRYREELKQNLEATKAQFAQM